RKSTLSTGMVLRERVRETRRDVAYAIDSIFSGSQPSEEFSARFERRIRDVASRSVAHLKRGDIVTVKTSAGERVRGTSATGADPVLGFLAWLEATAQASAAPPVAKEHASGPRSKPSPSSTPSPERGAA